MKKIKITETQAKLLFSNKKDEVNEESIYDYEVKGDTKSQEITILTDLLGAVADWGSGDIDYIVGLFIDNNIEVDELIVYCDNTGLSYSEVNGIITVIAHMKIDEIQDAFEIELIEGEDYYISANSVASSIHSADDTDLKKKFKNYKEISKAIESISI